MHRLYGNVRLKSLPHTLGMPLSKNISNQNQKHLSIRTPFTRDGYSSESAVIAP